MEKFISLQKGINIPSSTHQAKSKSRPKRKMSNKVDKHIKVKLRGSKEGSLVFEKENANHSQVLSIDISDSSHYRKPLKPTGGNFTA